MLTRLFSGLRLSMQVKRAQSFVCLVVDPDRLQMHRLMPQSLDYENYPNHHNCLTRSEAEN